jgi:hypothetical protein
MENTTITYAWQEISNIINRDDGMMEVTVVTWAKYIIYPEELTNE